jgi:glycosyltransferase involved in cell wall biosynthesis
LGHDETPLTGGWPSAATPPVSVVVPVHGARDSCMDQLASLEQQDYTGPWEIVVADNGMTTPVRMRVESWVDARPFARMVDATGRPGASYARNAGTAMAKGDLILYCDSDDLVAPWWVSAMVSAGDEHGFLAGVDDRLEPGPDGSPPAWVWEDRGGPYPAETETGHAFLPWARGGNFGIRRHLLDAVDGWNEEWLRGQDVELSWRLQLSGCRLHRVPNARVLYRRPTELWDDMQHQFEFGIRAPALYRAFGREEPALTAVRRSLRRLGWFVTHSPYLLLSQRRRRRWLIGLAGSAGRWVGTWQCRVGRANMAPRTSTRRRSGA